MSGCLKKYNMRSNYNEIELREMISNLRLVKESNKWGLEDQSELDLTTYELLLENYLNDKYKDIDKEVSDFVYWELYTSGLINKGGPVTAVGRIIKQIDKGYKFWEQHFIDSLKDIPGIEVLTPVATEKGAKPDFHGKLFNF